jgi:hypothetical protein
MIQNSKRKQASERHSLAGEGQVKREKESKQVRGTYLLKSIKGGTS